MNDEEKARYEARAAVLKAMAHPSRLFIVDRLSGREHSVQELTDMIGADMSTVSKHLSVLKSVGLVATDKRGLQVFYRLNTPCALRFFDCVEEVIQTNAKRQMKVAKGGGKGKVKR